MLNSIVNIGVRADLPNQLKNKIVLTNSILLILICIDLLLLVPFVYEDGWAIAAFTDLISLVVLISFIILNYFGFYSLSRLGTALYPAIIVMFASIAVKIYNFENIHIYDFFDSRILVVGFFILPFILFSYTEKLLLYSTIVIVFILIVAFDPIHSFFGVGYEDFFGFKPKAYIVSGVYMDIVIIFIAGALLYFKADIESLLIRNYKLLTDLESNNIELSALFEEVENANTKLTNQVEIKTSELKVSNEELIKHNNELQQFSSTLSHNLRGPVANLLGLSQLFKMDSSEENRMNVADHIFKSATALDDVIKDLNKVVDLKNNLYQIKEKIDIEKEIESIWFVFISVRKFFKNPNGNS